ncbi:MAG: hypothetical protein FWG90_02615 [Oscillospiraceae bacterium]|nr:hypothetical protein [Oscillospiraceae bacterium]
MKAEYTVDDLKGAIRNPFYEKLNKEVTVVIRRSDYATFEEVARTNDETPEAVMRRCLKVAAQGIREHD